MHAVTGMLQGMGLPKPGFYLLDLIDVVTSACFSSEDTLPTTAWQTQLTQLV